MMMKRKHSAWPIVVALLSGLWAVVTPLVLIFPPERTPYLLINTFISLFLLLDAWTGRAKKENELKAIRPRLWQMDTWTVFAIVTSLPYDLLLLSDGDWKMLSLIKVLRFISILRIYKEMNAYTEAPRVYRLLLIVLSALVSVHLVAVSWMALNPMPELSPGSAYLRSLYWAVTTLTTTGYGDITPTSDAGRIFTIFTMLMGFSAFGIIVGNISNLLMAKNRYLEANKEKMEDLALFMQHYDIPKNLRLEIYNFHGHRSKKRLSEDDNQIIADLPQAIQNELHIFMKLKLISNLPIFQGLSTACLKKVSQALEPIAFHASQDIIKIGERGNEMFIIDHGEVEVTNDRNMPIAILRHGQCFGEIALLKDIERTANVTSKSYCDIYCLNKEDFISIAKIHPELEENFKSIMSKRTQDKAA